MRDKSHKGRTILDALRKGAKILDVLQRGEFFIWTKSNFTMFLKHSFSCFVGTLGNFNFLVKGEQNILDRRLL